MVDKGESRRICSDRDEKGEDKQSRIGKVKHSTHRTKHNHRSKRTPSSSELSSPLDYRDRGRSRSSSYGKRRDLTPRRGSKTRDWSRSCESRRRVRLSRRSHEDNRHRSPARISHTKRYRYHHEDERYDSARRRRSTSASCDSYEYKRGRRYHPMDVRSRRRSNSPRSFSSYSGSSPLTSLSSASRSRVHSSLSTNDSKGRHPVSSRGRRRGSRSSSQDSRAKYKNPRPRKARLSRDSEEKVEESRAAASSINRLVTHSSEVNYTSLLKFIPHAIIKPRLDLYLLMADAPKINADGMLHKQPRPNMKEASGLYLCHSWP